MSEENSLVPIRQKDVEFYEDRITAAQARDGEIYVSIGQICLLLGVDRSTQYQKIENDAVLSRYVRQVVLNTAGGPQTTLCLPVDYMHGWLMSINANRVKDKVRDKLIQYQESCHRVLAEAFREGRLTTDPKDEDFLETSNTLSAQAYRTLRAITSLARQQALMETELGDHAVRLDVAETALANYGERLEDLETQLGDPDRFITPAQASRISQAVKAVALELGKRSGRNEFGAIYGELYRKFDVSSYKEIPSARYREAMDFLNEWYHSITDQDLDIPF